MLTAASLVLVTSAVLAQTEAKSTREDFKALGELMVGRWMIDVTYIADWPDQTKKQGEKEVGYSTIRWIADGNGLEWEQAIGNGTGKSLVMWDATTSQIMSCNVNTGGTGQVVIWKKSDTEWCWKLTGGGLNDGRKSEGTGTMVFKDGGKTFVLAGKSTLGGKALAPLNDVYTRVGK